MDIPKSRENPVILKLDPTKFISKFSVELSCLISIFKKNGHDIRLVGETVKDLLLEKPLNDIHLVTTANSRYIKKIFASKTIGIIKITSSRQGNISAKIPDKENIEISTLANDLENNVVDSSKIWLLDASKKDFTINSMSLAMDGSVYDYFYGFEDLKKKKVAFVGSVEAKIRENYLRILKYFTLCGSICQEPITHNEDTLTVMKEYGYGLSNISGSKIWTELKKILESKYAGELLISMVEIGLGPYIGLPENLNIKELKRVWLQSRHLNLNPITILSSLLNNIDDLNALHLRLNISPFEKKLGMYLIEKRAKKSHPKPLLRFQRQLLLSSISKPAITKKMEVELLKYNNSPCWEDLEKWEIPKFPVDKNTLKELGVKNGRVMCKVISDLKHFWTDNDFNLSEEDLLEQVPRILEVIEERRKEKEQKFSNYVF